MRKAIFRIAASVIGISVLVFLSGCLKDKCANTYTMYYPIYKSLTAVRADMRSGAPQTVGQTGKIYTLGRYIFLNEPGKGIHIVDNAQPAQPRNISFIKIPGNVDMAVHGSYLYADSYSDLVVFDISNPRNVTARKFVDTVFAKYYAGIARLNGSNNPDSIQMLVGYTQKDTTVDCNTYNIWSGCAFCSFADAGGRSFATPAMAAAAPAGKGGSMARFAILNDYLYSVSFSDLYSFNINDATDPKLTNKKNIGWNIETLYPFRDKLFIGSATGMFIYGTANAGNPSLVGQFGHVRSCDPVVADDTHAYVTLRSGTTCQGFTNQLEVLNITNVTNPSLVKTYALTNPHGLSKDGDLLFVCDGKDGLKIYDAANPAKLDVIKTIGGFDTYDVIAQNGIAIVVAGDGLYQYDYSDRNNIRRLSKITVTNE